MRNLMPVLFLVGSVLAAAASAAPALAQRSQTDCDKISDDDAFNKCLAAAGPTRAPARSRREPAAEAPAADRRSRRAQPTPTGRRAVAPGWQVQRVKGGRVRMVIPMSGRRR